MKVKVKNKRQETGKVFLKKSLSQKSKRANNFFDFNFKKHAIPVFISFALVVFAVLAIFNPLKILGATITFVQSSWAGGAHADTADDKAGNQTGWTKYSSADASISAGSNIALTTGQQTNTQTNDTDFNAGTFLGTAVTDTDTSASVLISSYNLGSIYSGNLVSGSQTFSYFGYNATIRAGTTMQIMFSEDLVNWYSANHTQNTWTPLQNGDHTVVGNDSNLNLSGFPASSTFYYQISITAASLSSVPILTSSQVH